MSFRCVPLKCEVMYVFVCVAGLFSESITNMKLVLAVTLEPQTSVCVCVCVCKPPVCMFLMRRSAGGWGCFRLTGVVLGCRSCECVRFYCKVTTTLSNSHRTALPKQKDQSPFRGQTSRGSIVALHSSVHDEDLLAKSGSSLHGPVLPCTPSEPQHISVVFDQRLEKQALMHLLGREVNR